jgi:hypothetical protein
MQVVFSVIVKVCMRRGRGERGRGGGKEERWKDESGMRVVFSVIVKVCMGEGRGEGGVGKWEEKGRRK